MTDLKLLIFGAGAIGTYIGGSLLALVDVDEGHRAARAAEAEAAPPP